jgi:hypothetical protein
MCVCVSLLFGCGHPIRDLADRAIKAGEGLVDDEDDKPAASSCPASATTRIALVANLYADTPLAPTWNPQQPEATSSFIVSGTAHASDGDTVDLRLCFAAAGERHWRWRVLATNAATPALELGAGVLVFGEDGALRSQQTLTTLRLPAKDGSLSAPVEFWLGTPESAEADGFDGVTSTSEPSAVESYEQNGRAGRAGECPNEG